jgi:ribulose-5-phosphate 4-epimerase/fuculose-1-phosphate aldolase
MAGDNQDMLVNTSPFGSALASNFSKPESSSQDHNVVLMANHGFTAIGTSIKQAVYRAVYTHVNSGIQSNAITLRSSQEHIKPGSTGEIRYLNHEQTVGTLKMNESSLERPWGLWEREVAAAPLYVREEPL